MNLPYQHTLPNGLKIFILKDQTKTVAIRLIGNAGASFESNNQIGNAHFLEHLVFEGTKKYPTDEILHKQIENLGGNFNASTGYTNVKYKVDLLKEDIETGLDFLSQVVLNPLLSENGIKKHKKIITEERNASLNSGLARAREKIQKDEYKSYRDKYSIIGDNIHIKKTSKTGIVKFYNETYNASNFVLGIASNYEPKELIPLISKYFGEMQKGDLLQQKKEEFTKKMVFNETDPEATQAQISISYPTYNMFDDRKYIVKAISRILGEGITSRLFRKVRQELGLVYAVYSDAYFKVHNGSFQINAGLDEKNIAKYIEILNKELIKISTEIISEEENLRDLKVCKADALFSQETKTGELTPYLYRYLAQLKYLTLDEILMLKTSRTKTEILNEAKKLFSQQPKIKVYSKNKLSL